MQLQVKHLTMKGPDIEIYFPKTKTDQLHEGNTTILLANETDFCQVKVVRVYLASLGLRIDEPASGQIYLHCWIRRQEGRWLPDKHVVSASSAREGLQKLLHDMQITQEGITDKSFKMLGVTRSLQAGASAEEVVLHGRWRSTDMLLRYKHNSLKFKRYTAGLVPL
jgi:hypothetical protein